MGKKKHPPLHTRVAALEKAIEKLDTVDLPAAFSNVKADNRRIEKQIADKLIDDFNQKSAGKI